MINAILKDVLLGKELGFEEAMKLLGSEQVDLPLLMHAANKIRHDHCGDRIDLCSLINAKSGLCKEDCKFCAQSAKYNTGCSVYPLVDTEKIIEEARIAKKNGATNFCIVISGTGPTKEDFKKIKLAIEKIKKEVGINVDCSLGKLDEDMAKALVSLGIERYNHNLETSEDFYKSICSTHNYSSRLGSTKMLKDTGLDLCCGGIIGLGESNVDRLNLAFTLKELGVGCVPINILDPRKGTPLENVKQLSPLDIIKVVAVFRLILKKAIIKVAGGRESVLGDLQSLAFMAGANGMIIGGYLTTKGRSVEEDLKMVKDLGFKTK
ncbi:MAG: biotin synthase BioB [Candidatus Omnitrophota bacterium]